MAWTNDLTLEFIELYKNEHLIWDPQHPQHKNRNEVTMAWNRIQSSMSVNFDVIDLKKKKESLMTTFRLLYNRKKRSPTYQTSWFAYSAMESFLRTRYESQLESQFFEVDTEPYNEEILLRESEAQDLDEKKSIYKHIRIAPCFSPNRKKQTFMLKADNKSKTETYTIQKGVKRNALDEMDECDLYCQLLAKKLKKLDEFQRDIAMHKIDKIIFHYKMQSCSIRRDCKYSVSSTLPDVKNPLLTEEDDIAQYEEEHLVLSDEDENDLTP